MEVSESSRPHMLQSQILMVEEKLAAVWEATLQRSQEEAAERLKQAVYVARERRMQEQELSALALAHEESSIRRAQQEWAAEEAQRLELVKADMQRTAARERLAEVNAAIRRRDEEHIAQMESGVNDSAVVRTEKMRNRVERNLFSHEVWVLERSIKERVEAAEQRAQAEAQARALAEGSKEQAVQEAVASALAAAAERTEQAVRQLVERLAEQLAKGSPEAVQRLVEARCAPLQRELEASKAQCRALTQRLADMQRFQPRETGPTTTEHQQQRVQSGSQQPPPPRPSAGATRRPERGRAEDAHQRQAGRGTGAPRQAPSGPAQQAGSAQPQQGSSGSWFW